MTKHTPGPWRVQAAPMPDLVEERWIEVFSVDPEDDVAQATGGNLKTATANACLIAAAPDLLNAIEHVLIASEDGGDMNDIDWDTLRRTAAKAKGGE